MKKRFSGCGKCSRKKTGFSAVFSFLHFVFLCIPCVFLISCRTLSHTTEPESNESLSIEKSFFSDEEISWNEIEEGFQIFSHSDSEIGVKYTLVKINLSNPNLEILSLLPNQNQRNIEGFYTQENSSGTNPEEKPSLENPTNEANPDNTKSGWTKTKSVEKFAKETDSLVAINTTPFMLEHKNPFSRAKPAGIQIAGGKIISGPDGKYSAIAFFKNRSESQNESQDENYKNPRNFRKQRSDGFHAEIFDSQSEIFSSGEETQNGIKSMPDFAHGGFWIILRNGEIKPFKEIKDVRSAAALKDSGTTLILFTGKPFTYTETARLFRKLGADSAIQFDGGSSANLVVNGKSCLKTGLKRKTASAIGFRLSKNPSGNPDSQLFSGTRSTLKRNTLNIDE